MRVGINLTSNKSLLVAKKLIDNNCIDFCEILVDNFISYDPSMIFDLIGNFPISFHIMNSRFLERSFEDLKELSGIIRNWINVIKPLYISDHIAKFTVNGRLIAKLGEINYLDDYEMVKSKVEKWQDILQSKIFFENFPSFLDYESNQIDFLESLKSETLCGILFDFSNAVIASENSSYKVDKWADLAISSEHFHIAGYRPSDSLPTLLIDTHDCPISTKSIGFFQDCLKQSEKNENKTIVLERDSGIDFNYCLSDIDKIRKEIDKMETECLI